MKALILSDVHANRVSLDEIWKRESGCDAIYCAGDLVDYGPFPHEVIAWMREHNAVCVKGNHDEHVVNLYRNSDRLWNVPDEERTWAHDNAQKLLEEDIAYLERLPSSVVFTMDSIAYCMQHMYNDYETIESIVQFDEFWTERTGERSIGASSLRRMIFGHTHRRTVHYLSDCDLWLNPGSVSYRRSDDPTKVAHYMTITDRAIQFKELSYDRSPLLAAVGRTTLSARERMTAEIFFA